MRRGGRALLGLALLVTGAAIATTAGPAAAVTQSITVTKVVDGSAPPSAQYVVDIDCEGAEIVPSSQLTFTGPGSQTVSVLGADVTCTVVESVTAGASVTYACEVTSEVGDTACVDDNAVSLQLGGGAIITVTNSHSPPAAPAAPEPAPAAAAAEPVAAAARFTG
jgi:hypothetical protein